MKGSRHIIIGDVHGCLSELRALLQATTYEPSRDRLVFVGDYLDRGPESVETLRFVRSLERQGQVTALMGNHDEKYVQYYRRQSQPQPTGPAFIPMTFPDEKQWIYAQLTVEDLRWLSERPYYYRNEGFLVVHAGIYPRQHLTVADLTKNRDSKNKLLRIRLVDTAGQALEHGKDQVPGAHPWWEDYDGRFGRVIHGHWRSDEVITGRFSYGIDTACCYGGQLTAMIFSDSSTPEFVQVRARQVYFSPANVEEED